MFVLRVYLVSVLILMDGIISEIWVNDHYFYLKDYKGLIS